jgi:Lrp/AsnC family leucine-responsive transcriptional regulator
MFKPDKFDCKILMALQRNARLTNLALAEMVGLSPSPCFRRVRALEDAGIIEGYHARINREAAGLGVTIFLNVNVSRHDSSHLGAAAKIFEDMPEIVSARTISGEYDFLLEVVVEDLSSYRTLNRRMSEMQEIREMRSHFVITDIKGAKAGIVKVEPRP